MNRRELICNIGEVKTGRDGDQLRATLGSCIGIALLWREKGRCALAHCFLPNAPGRVLDIGAKYVDQAVPSLLALLKIPVNAHRELEAVVVGGAQMLGADSSAGTRSIGRLNGETALQCLKKLGIRIVHLDIGGEAGRQISVDCSQFTYQVHVIGKDAA